MLIPKYENPKDGTTYYYITEPTGNKTLMGCPTNADNVELTDEDRECAETAVEEYAEPLTKKEIKRIVTKLLNN